MMKTTKSYHKLISLKSFEERFNYVRLTGVVGDITFGGMRELNQILYQSQEWRYLRREIILRDGGFDLAHQDRMICGKIYIHHINPITVDDILERRACVFDPENLISVSFNTHNAIHYGTETMLIKDHVPRSKNDTCPWR